MALVRSALFLVSSRLALPPSLLTLQTHGFASLQQDRHRASPRAAIPPRLAPHFANVLLSCCCVLQVASPSRRQAMPFFSSYHNVHFHEERCFCCRPVRRCLRCCSRHVVAGTRLCRCYHCRPRLPRVGTVLPGGIPRDWRRNHRMRLLAGDRAGIQILTPPASYQGAGARGKSVHPPWA